MTIQTKTELEEFLQGARVTEKQLLTLVTGSFLFSLVPAAAAYDSGTSLRDAAMVQLVGACMGAAGALSAFFSGYVHPAEKYEILDYKPVLAGLGVIALVFISVLCFCLSYFLANSSRVLSLLFIALGTFFFFRMAGQTVIATRRIEDQKTLWDKMTPEMRRSFLVWQADRDKARDEAHDTAINAIEKAEKVRAEVRKTVKELAAERRREKWESRREKYAAWFLRVRKRIGGERLLSERERMEERFRELRVEAAGEAFKAEDEFLSGGKDGLVIQVLRGEKPTLPIEGTNMRAYKDKPFFFAVADGNINTEIAKECTVRLKAMSRPGETICVIVPRSSQITLDAMEAFRSQDVEVRREEDLRDSGKEEQTA
jgi:hypothetical protein